MKNLFNLSRLLFAAFAVLATVSCQQSLTTTDPSVEEDSSTITFLGDVGTRATDTQFEEGDEISVTAYDSEGAVFAGNVLYSYSGSLFSSDSPIRYESEDQELSFKALYPYVEFSDSGDFSFSVLSDQSSADGYTLSDLMSSSVSSTTSVTPSLTFSHLLTKVIINFSTVDVDMSDAVTTLSVLTGVDYNINTQGYVATGAAEAVMMSGNGVNSFKAIIVPQNIESGVHFGEIVVGGESYEIIFENGKIFKAGSEYEFDLTIREGSLSFVSSYINDWDDGDDSSEGSSEFSLSEVSSSSYPYSSKTWIVTDSVASYSDFAGLRDALNNYRWTSSDKIMLEFPNLTSLPTSALRSNYGFESISLPVATSIGQEALYSCTYLALVDAPLVDTIYASAFYNCTSLTAIDLQSATTFGASTFYSCTALSTIDLPSAIIIYDAVFSGCSSLTSISLPSVTSVGNSAFKDCAALSSLTLATESELVEFGDGEMNCFDGVDISSIDLIISSGLGVVDGTVIMPVADNGFVNYGSFKSVTGGTAYDDVAPTSIQDYSATNYPLISNDWVIEDIDTPLAYYVGLNEALRAAEASGRKINLTFPNLTKFPSAAFYVDDISINSIVSITAPNVLTVSEYAFYSCDALSTLSLQNAVDIDQYAFYDCDALTTVSLPSATIIGSHAFCNCDALTTVSLPSTTAIGSYAFSVCKVMNEISLPLAEIIEDNAFYNCASLARISLPLTRSVANSAFSFCSSISDLYIPLLETIESYAFYSCESLLEVDFPLITSVPSETFHGCTSLQKVSLPLVETVGSNAFQTCKALTEISLPELISVGTFAFYSCSALQYVSLPLVESIDGGAFFNCSSIESIHFPNLQTLYSSSDSETYFVPSLYFTMSMTLYYASFGNCTALKEVNLPKVTSIGSSVFSNCTNLSDVSLPEIDIVPTYAFASCSNLTSISLPKATAVEAKAFDQCTTLSDISLSNAVSVSSTSFSGCKRLQSVSLPALSVLDNLFSECYMLLDLEVASNEGVVLEQFGSMYEDAYLFEGIDISYMTLTTSETNKNMVGGNYITAPAQNSNYSYGSDGYTTEDKTYGPFKEIILQNSSY